VSCVAAAWQPAQFFQTTISNRHPLIHAAPTAARLLMCISVAGAMEFARLLAVAEDLTLLARKACMYSIPAATLSSGVSSSSRDTEEEDEAGDGALLRELRPEECAEKYGGGGAVGSLKGLLKMTALLELSGERELVSWGSCVCFRASGCEFGQRMGFVRAMSAPMGPRGRGWPQL